MSNIDKQELREAAERAESDSWGYDRDEFNEALTPSTVLALLDELEAKEKRISEQRLESRLLANADSDIASLRQRIAELEVREVQLPPKAPDNLASCLDGYEKWLIATTFRDTWNACLAEVVRVNDAAGKGESS
ncbi:ead/Ea22-like family protein [Enterobacter kobei]|uniref:ead/Ea22-like family protein n=1 Tax=Enterobacter kobei TaxID=208224 RepID=UPI00207CB4A9|nr:ead/Ea22-like family protein [Enterobacter kobei]MCO4129652.1 ead/Ea22-like family protein [Enterobacter kobei]MCO4186867.1 ead/Ea22-like family protein [Enterobacter kobei]